MCLGIPGKVVSLQSASGLRMGKVSFGGVVREVCLEYVPKVALGDHVIVHAGFAISVLDEVSARESLALLDEMEAALGARKETGS